MRVSVAVTVLILFVAINSASADAPGDELFTAAASGDAAAAQRVLDQEPVAIRATDAGGRTAVHVAALNGRLEICKLLLDRGANVNARDNDGAVPLALAVSKGAVEVARLLVERGAELYAMTGEGNAPIHEAARAGQTAAVRCLLAAGARVDTANISNSDTPLIVAARYGWTDVVRLLMAFGANPTLKNKAGLTAIDEARHGGKSEVTAVLNAFASAAEARDAAVSARNSSGLALRSTADAWEKSDLVTRNVYASKFASGKAGREWSLGTVGGGAPKVVRAPSGNRQFAGELCNQALFLSLNGLPPHKELSLAFDLMVLRGWGCDGGGPEIWSVGVVGGPTLLQTSFYSPPNVSDFASLKLQAFPGEFPVDHNPGFNGAFERDSLGYSARVNGRDYSADAVYRLGFTFAHTAGTVTFKFEGRGLDALTKEAWGLDAVSVAVPAAPGSIAPVRNPAPGAPRRSSTLSQSRGLARRASVAHRTHVRSNSRTARRRMRPGQHVVVHPIRLHARKEAPAP